MTRNKTIHMRVANEFKELVKKLSKKNDQSGVVITRNITTLINGIEGKKIVKEKIVREIKF